MTRSHVKFRTLASFVLLLVLTSVAQALPFRTWVAGNGNDANPCTLALPCQTFAAAITQTASGGEINAKSAGEFGPMFISKSLTIDGGGVFSGINVGGGISHVVVNDAASPTPNTAVVTLRNLSINGAGQTLGSTGVSFSSGKTLNIENCRIFNFSYGGVSVGVAEGTVSIKNTNIFNANSGVVVEIYPGYVTVLLNGCNIEQNTLAGVNVLAGGYISIRDSVIQFNGKGVYLQTAGSTVNIIGGQVNHNTTGLHLSASTTATIGGSTFMSNSTNLVNTNFGSLIRSFGNNQTETDPIPGTVIDLGLR